MEVLLLQLDNTGADILIILEPLEEPGELERGKWNRSTPRQQQPGVCYTTILAGAEITQKKRKSTPTAAF